MRQLPMKFCLNNLTDWAAVNFAGIAAVPGKNRFPAANQNHLT